MTLGPLLTEVVVTFCLAAGLLYKYGNWLKHHIIVTVAVLVAWYFSFLIIFILPLDVSSVSARDNELLCMTGEQWSHIIILCFMSWHIVIYRAYWFVHLHHYALHHLSTVFGDSSHSSDHWSVKTLLITPHWMLAIDSCKIFVIHFVQVL